MSHLGHRRYLIIFLTYDIKDYEISFVISFIYNILHHIAALDVLRGGAKATLFLKFRVLTSLLTSRVSCPSPWARQNFPAPLKIEQALSHR